MLRKAGSLFPNNTLFGSKGVNLDEIIKGRMKLLVNVCPTELYQSAKLSRESFLNSVNQLRQRHLWYQLLHLSNTSECNHR